MRSSFVCFSSNEPSKSEKKVTSDDEVAKKSTTTIRTNMSTMKRRNHNKINKMSPSKSEETVTTEKPKVVRGGASDFYTKFKRRHRFGENPPTTSTSTTTDIAQERSDFVEVHENLCIY